MLAIVLVLMLLSCFRLQKEALKQAAVDPATGKIDISILTTGISGEARKQRATRAKIMKEVIRTKGKVVTLKVAKIFEEFKEKLIEKGEKVIVFVIVFNSIMVMSRQSRNMSLWKRGQKIYYIPHNIGMAKNILTEMR